MLVLMPGNATRRELLFVKDGIRTRALTDGCSVAKARTGIATVLSSAVLTFISGIP
jgi:hypothetical protein